MHAALEAVENAFDPVFVTIAQDRIGQRQPLLCRVGDKGLPAEPCGEGGNGVFLAGNAGDVVADVLTYLPSTLRRASAPADVVGLLLDLPFPGNGEQALYPLLLEHPGNRLHQGYFVGELAFAPPACWREGRQLLLRMHKTFFQTHRLVW